MQRLVVSNWYMSAHFMMSSSSLVMWSYLMSGHVMGCLDVSCFVMCSDLMRCFMMWDLTVDSLMHCCGRVMRCFVLDYFVFRFVMRGCLVNNFTHFMNHSLMMRRFLKKNFAVLKLVMWNFLVNDFSVYSLVMWRLLMDDFTVNSLVMW